MMEGMSMKNLKPMRVRLASIGLLRRESSPIKNFHRHSVNGMKNTPRFELRSSIYSESSNVSLAIVRNVTEALKKWSSGLCIDGISQFISSSNEIIAMCRIIMPDLQKMGQLASNC